MTVGGDDAGTFGGTHGEGVAQVAKFVRADSLAQCGLCCAAARRQETLEITGVATITAAGAEYRLRASQFREHGCRGLFRTTPTLVFDDGDCDSGEDSCEAYRGRPPMNVHQPSRKSEGPTIADRPFEECETNRA
jgi:hypothetical protein